VLELDASVYALDFTTIDLCLSLFDWAPFRSTKAAVKLHILDVNYFCAAATIRTVHPPLCPSSSGPAGCGKRAAFSKGCGRVPGGRVGVAAFHTPADRRPG
jgi:hypothetical protein